MLSKFLAELTAYANSRWAAPILLWSSFAFFAAGIAFWIILGFGSSSGTGTGATLVAILSLVIAVPATIVFNLSLALIWAFVMTIVRLFTT